MAFFEGLVETDEGLPVSVVYGSGKSYYVIDDQGFRRHVEAADIDRPVLQQFLAQLQDHRDEASAAMLRMMGQDDLFTKAMVDSALRKIDVEQLLNQSLPADARQWLGMLGFRVIIDRHGELVRLEMPAGPDDRDEE